MAQRPHPFGVIIHWRNTNHGHAFSFDSERFGNGIVSDVMLSTVFLLAGLAPHYAPRSVKPSVAIFFKCASINRQWTMTIAGTVV